MVINSASPARIKKLTQGIYTDADDWLAIEEPLEIKIQYKQSGRQVQKTISVTMRTPGQDAELSVGFLFTEGIIQHTGVSLTIVTDPMDDNKVLVILDESQQPFLQHAERNFYTSSSCGVCGKTSIDAIKSVSPFLNIVDNACFDEELFYSLPRSLKEQQSVFKSTGGLHGAALFDEDGKCITIREDIGRHNALDKVIGAAFLNQLLPLNNCILLLSGRASFELLQKAMMAGIRVVAAIGAPSSLAVQLAEEAGITLLGFLSHDRFNIYSAPHRIRNTH